MQGGQLDYGSIEIRSKEKQLKVLSGKLSDVSASFYQITAAHMYASQVHMSAGLVNMMHSQEMALLKISMMLYILLSRLCFVPSFNYGYRSFFKI